VSAGGGATRTASAFGSPRGATVGRGACGRGPVQLAAVRRRSAADPATKFGLVPAGS